MLGSTIPRSSTEVEEQMEIKTLRFLSVSDTRGSRSFKGRLSVKRAIDWHVVDYGLYRGSYWIIIYVSGETAGFAILLWYGETNY